MRPLEIAYLLLNLPLVSWCVLNLSIPWWGRILPVLSLVVLAVSVVVEGSRWTLLPALAVTCWLFYACTWPRLAQPGRWSGLSMLGLLLVAGLLANLLPVFKLPTPTGSFRTGTVTRHLIDHQRQELQGDRPGGPRELMIQIWYPTNQVGQAKTYRDSGEVSWSKQHLALVRTHSAEDVALAPAPKRFPLLIFTPSWTGRRNQNTTQAEELASHGFIVVGIQHPYSADLTVFPDGRKARSTLGEFLDCTSDESVAHSVQVARDQLELRTADVRFVLDTLERLDREEPEGLLHQRIDFDRVGVFGHSFGGAVAAETCRVDPRVKAGIDYDGLIFGGVLDHGVGKPFLFLMDGTPVPTNQELEQTTGPWHRELVLMAENFDLIRHNPAAEGYWASLKGANHMNYSDSPFYTPIRKLSHAGTIDPVRAEKIINACTLSFFNKYLNHDDNRLLDGPERRFPELEMESLYVKERTQAHAHKYRYQLAEEHP
ncbi:carboxylic ester hydrolase [soil metagenome]